MERCENCDDLRSELTEAKGRAYDFEYDLDKANEKIARLEERIAEMSTKINAVYSDMNDLYRMAD